MASKDRHASAAVEIGESGKNCSAPVLGPRKAHGIPQLASWDVDGGLHAYSFAGKA